jgi:branched-chain amino acid transport system permease protein
VKWGAILPFVAFLLAAAAAPFVTGLYGLGVAFQLLMWIALTESWIILSGMTGYISLGHVVFFGLGAYVTVLTWQVLPLYVALPLAGMISFAFAIVVGWPVLRVRGPYFVILTFGLAELVKYIAIKSEAALGESERLLFGVPELETLYWIMFVLAVVATVIAHTARMTRFGQGLLAIREDEEAAATIGVPVVRYKILAYGLSALSPGVVGGVVALRTTYFEASAAFDPMISFTILTMAIIGGSDDARGPLLGAAFFTLLSELLWAKAPEIYSIFLGIALIAFVLALPEGICGRLFPRTKQAQ